jgi:choline dehydrogenase
MKTGTFHFLIITILFCLIDVEAYSSSENDGDKSFGWHNKRYKKCLNVRENNCYDYIIVGSGTAGSILARKLSEDPRNKVLLIEQGYWLSLNPNVQEASKWRSLLSDPLVELGYVSVPQAGLGNRTIRQPRAKGTGGCNSMNAMAFLLGNRKDFDERWGQIDGWSWNDIAPYWDYINETFPHTQINPNDRMMRKLLKSAEELGYKYNPNPNDLDSEQGQGGVAPRIYMAKQTSNNYAERVSSWNAYVQPILPRENLDILVFTHVSKILFNQNLEAIGVKTYNVGKKENVYFYSRKEVIISAGAFDTPKLLLLSGIGPCDELATHNIKCLSNVPGVGKNLQDHTIITIWSSPLLNQDTPLPIQLLGGWGAVAIEENGEHYHVLSLGEINGVKAIKIFVETFHYKSRGSVTLLDNNPLSKPVIDPNYLSNSYDRNKTLNTVKIGRSFLSTKIISRLTEDRRKAISPSYSIDDDKKLLEWIKKNAETGLHPSSTCTMGNSFEDDDMIVVDKRLRVRNTKKLRIVDASIIPTLISGNPNQITMIIAFKAGDMIVEDNDQDDSSVEP